MTDDLDGEFTEDAFNSAPSLLKGLVGAWLAYGDVAPHDAQQQLADMGLLDDFS